MRPDTFDWLVFVFLVVLGWVVPAPVTRRQQIVGVVCLVLLVLMAFTLLRGWL